MRPTRAFAAQPILRQVQLLHAQEAAVKLYDPSADAALELRAALASAAATGRHVLLQIGGNWCPWCVKLDKLFKPGDSIRVRVIKIDPNERKIGLTTRDVPPLTEEERAQAAPQVPESSS